MNVHTISQTLRDAIKAELANSHYEFPADNTVLLHVAESIRRNSPEKFDLTNTMDRLIWVFAGGEL